MACSSTRSNYVLKKEVFKDKIIPLLQEYFYGDYEKLGLLLGNGFVGKNGNKEIGFADFAVEDLDIYEKPIYEIRMEPFRSVKEFEEALHSGLIKKYHKQKENIYALKGSLNFNKQLNKNLIHAERFYVKHSIYDFQHELNKVLFKTLNVILGLNASFHLISDIKALSINMPELSDIQVSEGFFGRIKWTRKNEHYKAAIEITRLLLLNYHPDLSHGKNNVLALMFDVNDLWEKWFAKRLKAVASDVGLPLLKKRFQELLDDNVVKDGFY
ncbi:MAG: hypothetical protein JXB24_04860 [Bacteroidales bacterium]|nr:hypothetical protein [Bacteroidales bacterium]